MHHEQSLHCLRRLLLEATAAITAAITAWYTLVLRLLQS
jgi:hypothetical protein